MLKSTNYQTIIDKIEEFIKKFYLNQIIKGSIWQVGIFLVCFLCIISLEYYGYYGITTKTITFYGFIISQLSIFYFLIFRYLLKYWKLGKTLDYETASKIIGDHFPDVKDKLLNTLQLNQQYNQHQNSLLEASINQKINDLKPIPFVAAIRLKENKKYAKFAIIPLSILLILAFAAPSILTDGTNRIINHNQFFEEPAPFSFVIQNKNLLVSQGDDLNLNIKMQGQQVPKDVYLEDGTNTYKVNKEGLVNFSYKFRNLQNNKKFRLSAAGYYSKPYEIQVYKKPAILSYDVSINYPAYTKKRNETLKNPSDLTFPAGTILIWKLKTEYCATINFSLGKKTVALRPNGDNEFVHKERVLHSANYSIAPQNNSVSNSGNMSYQLTSIPDEFPSIAFEETPDSINPKIIYFKGKIRDDYGFSALKFHFKIIESTQKSRIGISKNIPIKINTVALEDVFFHFWDLNRFEINAGEEIEYYFSVSDNDGINGPKTVKSVMKTYKTAIKDDAIKQLEAKSKSLTQKMQQAAKQAKQIQQDAQKINQELLSKSALDFEDKKHAEELIAKQLQLQNLLKDIEKEAKKNQLAQKEINPENQALIEKQKEIQELFEKVLDDKTKKLLENLQKLLDENNKEQLRDKLQEMKADNKMLEKEFDRMLELYKKLVFEQKLDNAANKLKDLSEKQNELSKQSEKNKDNEKSLQKQQELQKEFSEVKKDLKELDQKKEDSRAEDFKNPESDQQEIEKDMQEAKNKLEQKQLKNASKPQKDAAKKMSDLSKKLSDMQSGMAGEENKVNEQELRNLLKNVLKASFDEEKILTSSKKTNINDSKFTDLGKQQKNIAINLKTIQDSLYSLSKRVPQITAAVNKETQSINFHVNKTLEYITERKQAETLQSQQYVLTSINNLALMLSDALEQLQKAMQSGKSGKGKPQPNMQQLSKMQQELNKNMQKAKEGMEQQGGLKPGQKPGDLPSSKEFSQMAQQQQMIREAMENLNKNGQKLGGGVQKAIADMQQTETDLVYKRISQEVLLRQQQIQTKLLEAAKAEREREQDTQKESTTAKEFAPDYNLRWQQYLKQKSTDLEMIKTLSPTLNYFYKQKVINYYKNLNLSK